MKKIKNVEKKRCKRSSKEMNREKWNAKKIQSRKTDTNQELKDGPQQWNDGVVHHSIQGCGRKSMEKSSNEW